MCCFTVGVADLVDKLVRRSKADASIMSIKPSTPDFEQTIVVGGIKWMNWALADDRRWTLTMIAVVISLSVGAAVLGAKLASEDAWRPQATSNPPSSAASYAKQAQPRKSGQVASADQSIANAMTLQ